MATDRNETEPERADRNWNELLQELRVTRTGVQILSGFLLTLPFQQRFTQLSPTYMTLFLTAHNTRAGNGHSLAMVTVVVLIFGVFVGTATGLVAGALVLAFYVFDWVLLPVALLRRQRGPRMAHDP